MVYQKQYYRIGNIPLVIDIFNVICIKILTVTPPPSNKCNKMLTKFITS